MEIIKHRVLSVNEIDKKFGAEIDVRDHDGKIVLSHAMSKIDNEFFSDFLEQFPRKSFLAINVKSSEIENKLKDILTLKNHQKYFVFDFAFPSLRKALKLGLNCAFRLSEYEKDIHNNCDWVWVDCFDKIWYDKKMLEDLKKRRLKIALVSPEIHNRSENKDEFEKIKEFVRFELVDAICTDNAKFWDKV